MSELKNIAVIGCGGAIGQALVRCLAEAYPNASLHGFSRRKPDVLISGVTYHNIDYQKESTIQNAANLAASEQPLDWVVVATGLLHEGDITPEKSLSVLSVEKFERLFAVNTIAPAMLAKHFLPKMNRQAPSIFAALSARVGSISDNRLGGWYAYRASKAALNMIIKNAAIEMARFNKKSTVVCLHPGTVDSDLSKPFQSNVPAGKLFTPDYAAQQLISVMQQLTPQQSGLCIGWDGKTISP
jgi:NAD(P)-dependent dehydrogenase (short-subunit alcohol dehydrogenase family)